MRAERQGEATRFQFTKKLPASPRDSDDLSRGMAPATPRLPSPGPETSIRIPKSKDDAWNHFL